MSAEAVAIAALGFATVGLLWDAVSQRRLLRAVRKRLSAHDSALTVHAERIDETAHDVWKQEARVNRLQRMVTDQGWRDSLLLTKFDWRKPGDRG